jgi:hypothetical protein
MEYERRLEKVSLKLAKRWNTLLSSRKLGPKMSDMFVLLTASLLSKMYGAE